MRVEDREPETLVSSEAKQELEASLQRRSPDSRPVTSASPRRGPHGTRTRWPSLALAPASAPGC